MAACGGLPFSAVEPTKLAWIGNTNKETQVDVLANIDLLNKSISGVSLDEEMVNLMKYQRGFQASARALSTTNSLIDTLLNMGT